MEINTITKLDGTTRTISDITINNRLVAQSVDVLKPIVLSLSTKLGKDDKFLQQFFRRGIRKDSYGKVPAAINKLVALYASPIIDKPWDAQLELDLQDEIIETLQSKGWNITHDMMLDIKEYKGFNSFMDDEYNVVSGEEPNYVALYDAYVEFAEAANLSAVDFKMTEEVYSKNESIAMTKIQRELDEIKLAKAASEALQSA